MTPDVDQFEVYRPLLFSIAYRMLGSGSDAEDIVQDAWLRYASADAGELRSPKGYLTTIVTRLCLDRLKSARMAREQYVGPWLPEPLLTDTDEGPERSAALAESLTLAFMVLLETLTPEERAVFLLREVFEHSHEEIASMLDLTPANSRQLFHRAKERVASRRPRFQPDDDEKRQLVRRFVGALRDGDAAGLTEVLADDVGFWGDGGGKVIAARRPVAGREHVVHLLLGIRRTAASYGIRLDRVTVEIIEVNSEPAVLFRVEGRIDSVYTCSVVDGVITGIRVVRNPDKLTFIGRQLSHERSQATESAPETRH